LQKEIEKRNLPIESEMKSAMETLKVSRIFFPLERGCGSGMRPKKNTFYSYITFFGEVQVLPKKIK